MRLICTSNIDVRGMSTPVSSFTLAASRALFSSLTAAQRLRKAASSANGLRPASLDASLIHSSDPSASVISAASPGLQKASQRRGVTPLVLFWNFSGCSA